MNVMKKIFNGYKYLYNNNLLWRNGLCKLQAIVIFLDENENYYHLEIQ